MLIIKHYVKSTTVYVLRTVIVFCILVLIAILAFNIAFNQFRVRIFVNDAFTARANVILENTGENDLTKFFDEEFLNNDQMLLEDKYALYDVSRYEYKLDINHIRVGWVAPTKATVTISEYVTDIKGQFTGEAEEKGESGDTPPEWQPARYKVRMKKYDGKWYIVKMEKMKDLK